VSEQPFTPATKVVASTTAALSFISCWRGAATVFGDLAPSAFQVSGKAEHIAGSIPRFGFAAASFYLQNTRASEIGSMRATEAVC
jgi:hypothetical protein